MRRPTARQVSEIAITVQFLALVRTAAEFFRLRHVQGSGFTIHAGAGYVAGTMIAAVGAWAATTAFFFGRYRTATVIVGATIALMLVYKFVFLQ